MATIHERIDRTEFRISPMPEARHAHTCIEAIREFTRFYTRRIGVPHEGLLDSKFPLHRRSRAEVSSLLATLTETQQQQLPQSMAAIERLLGEPAARQMPYLLRPHRAGDIGWVISRHGALYADEYAWDLSFEALVARIAADFLEHFDAAREACWIAERDGANVGSVFLVQARDETTRQAIDGVAQLRLLLVEPAARGLGLGKRLVDECQRFARRAGYRKIVLWTHSELLAARAIYRKAGYTLVRSQPHRSFGQDLVGETWELGLQ